ncbi:hypothetical protein [Paraburkholderia aspalathi]|uniref:hypothetical protein n=1 Tax=Paraburkholderia aspalathi TaxID=1324617 RepID=UPI0038BCE6F2
MAQARASDHNETGQRKRRGAPPLASLCRTLCACASALTSRTPCEAPVVGDKEMNMKSKSLTCAAAVAATLLSLSGAAHAKDPTCSNETLRGLYGFSAQGEILGIIGTDGAVHYAKSRLLLNDVAVVNFDANGNFTRNDAGNIGGLPKSGGAFNSVQFGTYNVNSDCTGTMTINYGTKASPAGVVPVVNIVISSDATLVIGEMTSETVPFAAAPPTVDGTCGNPCSEAVQISFEGKKVLAYGFR